MSADLDPIVGSWYRRLDENQLFTVVGIDEDSGLIEIQYFDGDLSEIDTSLWAELELEAAAEPEDWGYSDTETSGADWRRPLESIAAGEEEDWETESEDTQEKEDWDTDESGDEYD